MYIYCTVCSYWHIIQPHCVCINVTSLTCTGLAVIDQFHTASLQDYYIHQSQTYIFICPLTCIVLFIDGEDIDRFDA